jgi:hypothetical protein
MNVAPVRATGPAIAIGVAALTLVAAPACTREAHLGYWVDDLGKPAGSAGRDGAGTAGAAGTLAGSAASSPGDMSVRDSAVPVLDASSPADAGVAQPVADADNPAPDAGTCDLGGGVILPEEITVAVAATQYFARGISLPAGRYRVAYVDGCRKFNAFGGWTVHGTPASITRATAYTIITDDGAPLQTAPGTFGLLAGAGADPYGAFETYAECVAANREQPALDLDFAGGMLGIVDGDDGTPFDDVTGESEGGRNPTFDLSRLDPCP